MLKLKYLFHNVDLAEMLVKNWAFDEDSLEMFTYYRISSNAIYPFRDKGDTHFLRFAPQTEKNRDHWFAELDFISYLRSKHYGVLETVLSLKGEKLVEMQTPWGDYYASVFKQVAGVQMNETDLRGDIIFSYGKALGRLHQLSNTYLPKMHKCWSYHDVLHWVETTLKEFPQETLAIKEAEILKDYFDSLPKTKSNVGLIHYDFEFDNVFYDEASNTCNVIDFDDAMYHWYIMDVERALDSLQDCIPPERFEKKKQCFLEGYRTEYDVSDEEMSLLPACSRFANLYKYTRVLRSEEETWDNEPHWVVQLREALRKHKLAAATSFGTEL
ncbi:phosphotransferase enzyme family protein [Aureibacillus halotolerans]|uniref:Ser/Thr protein kinase RdoA (MazF antagonist) n=1 Tax=Aureibacillus halotolerans TaxID=1508390 RepID=A0A4R6U2U0_9BACI|nr:phosphotransferase [Aureibacillus halotolerans]TDQ40748.1 Ser/Thr protein kinase RdoA (MazF antagonist) [Aureibacillus halotolerans]